MTILRTIAAALAALALTFTLAPAAHADTDPMSPPPCDPAACPAPPCDYNLAKLPGECVTMTVYLYIFGLQQTIADLTAENAHAAEVATNQRQLIVQQQDQLALKDQTIDGFYDQLGYDVRQLYKKKVVIAGLRARIRVLTGGTP